MVDKTVSIKELQLGRDDGDEFELDPDTMTIERFGELIDAIKTMAANEAERIRADIARNQTNLEILATLQSMVRKAGDGPKIQPVDMAPVLTMLEEIRNDRMSEPVDYDFNIIRPGGDGFHAATRIEARAVKPTTH